MTYRITRVILAFVVGSALGWAMPAHSQSMAVDLGEFEYMNSCAACHGASADGRGPVAELLTVPAPDLTQLQKNNGGVFPVSAAFAMIQGTEGPAAHGTRDMPAWGMRYQERASRDEDFSPLDAEQYPTIRILALIEYLSQIQAE